MESKGFSNISLRTFSLELNETIVINEGNVIYYLKSGTLALFVKETGKKLSDEKLRHINEYVGPCIIPICSKTKDYELSITAITICNIDVLANDAKLKDKNISNLIDKFIHSGIESINILQPTTLPISYNYNNENICTETGYIHTLNINDVRWLCAKNANLNFVGKILFPKGRYVPVTRQYWYEIEKDVSFNVLSTSDLIKSGENIFDHLMNFWSRVYDISEEIINVRGQIAFNQLKANKENDDSTMVKSRDELFTIINKNFKEENPFTDDDPLYQCLEQIGRYEQIKFKKPTTNNVRFDSLDNILRVSEIRCKTIQLTGDWYKHNSGALLAYTKKDNSPIALIPKGERTYIAYDFINKTETKVDKANSSDYKLSAIEFFTPFFTKKVTAWSMLNFGFQFGKKDLTYFVVLGIISTLIALLLPISTGYIFNNIIPNSSINGLTQVAIILIILAFSMGILNFAKSISVLRLEGTLTYKLQSAIWDRILSLKVSFFKKYDAGNLAERSMGIDKIRKLLSGTILDALISFIFSFFFLALLFYYSFYLALVGLALGMLIVVFTVIASYIAYKHVMAIKIIEVSISGLVYQIISGINKIRVTRSEERAFRQWVNKFDVQKQHYADKKKVNVAASVFGAFFPIFSAICIFIVVIYLISNPLEKFTVGDYIAFNTAFLSFQGALLRMAMITVPLLTMKPIFNMFKPIIEADMEYNEQNEDPGELSGDISVTNLTFGYGEDLPLILKDINFRINAGEYIALVGGSGSGKSTLIRLLLGFEEANSGVIYYGDKNISKVNIRELRSQISVVLQNEKLMAGTVLYNIIGNSNLTEDDAWEAAKKAGCYDEINELPDKMYTNVIEGGSTLSGGQVQRIIIASAFVKKNKIIIFDEATSALDNITQKTVTESMDNMSATKIVIAHRLSTVMKANRIIVLDKGSIIESGTYDELINDHGRFSELVKEQLV
ncbi:MAG: NHLP bacteriocin export ABC transporter permease/ATPase subunit [Bacteroidales bacterium]|jgi:NHLM bacteriocin system ABC transporter ATP-binding protein|nr:NHLP bacteriocin export ABC transporter permease/ATPase subunit [Bacteroidales bacterium]MDG2080611.1 NHLP bacteriocin export ABC transporter permease/ATPase subunit [Bacteroidales bacterium]|tara:strand:- start:983 stop:3850 length:2868 start_codon:yes stop_codon:yes gene_type:complete